jgi:hypothetical protein
MAASPLALIGDDDGHHSLRNATHPPPVTSNRLIQAIQPVGTAVAWAALVGTLLYAVGFLGTFTVPKSVDLGARLARPRRLYHRSRDTRPIGSAAERSGTRRVPPRFQFLAARIEPVRSVLRACACARPRRLATAFGRRLAGMQPGSGQAAAVAFSLRMACSGLCSL